MRAKLAALVGSDGVDPAGAGTPVRVRPSHPEQVAGVLALASREGWRVWPAGSGSRRTPHRFRPDLVLSTERLVGLTVYEPDDMTLGALAGSRHGDLDAAVAKHRQLLPLAPAAGNAATLGGTLALADAGPLRAGYGTPRDLALGLTVVAGDGRILEFGGRVVKNVAGYDVVRLLVGSRGSLAVITAFHTRLRSHPERDVTLLLDAPDARAAADLALAVRDAAAPVALEAIAPRGPTGWQVAARLHGSAAAVAAAVTAASRAAGARGRELDGPAATTWWEDRARDERSLPFRLRLTALPDRTGVLLAAADRFLKSWSDNDLVRAAGWCQGHATEGIVRLGSGLPGPPAGAAERFPRENATRLGAALGELAATVVSVGGTWTYDAVPDSWPGPGAEPLPEPSPRAPAVLRIERDLKARFDPAGVLPEAFG